MVAPADYDVTILVNDVDVTRYVPAESMALDDYARQVSTFRFTIQNPSGITPQHMHTVVMTWNFDDSIIFNGYIFELKTRKRDNGITVEYECDCQDRKALLQRSILGGNDFTGSDLGILGDLLSNSYPDLSDLFDFSSGVNSLMDSLDFVVEDGMNLLDALTDLADLVGAEIGFEPGSAAPTGITYELARVGTADVTVNSQFTETAEGSGDPIPTNAAALTEDSAVGACSFRFEVQVTLLSGMESIEYVSMNGYVSNGGGDSNMDIELIIDGTGSYHFAANYVTNGNGAGWFNCNSDDHPDDGTPHSDNFLRFKVTSYRDNDYTNVDWRIDDIIIQTDVATYTLNFDSRDTLQWNDEAPAADYDIDVQAGGEYASDIDFTVGSLDAFNSVTVVGGYEEVTITKQLDNDGVRDHIGLPYPVKSLAVYLNTGTDTTPVWGSALALGAWGSDTLISGGGTKDVLLDAEHNVLLFNTAPSNLVNAYKITGTIQRPIRVRVENVADGDLTLATSYSDEKIASVDEAVAIGQAQLEQKNATRQLSFKTNHPGLKPGQAITVADSARGLSELVTIRRISTTWMGPVGFFDVDCGDDDENSVDAIIANNDKRSRASGVTTSPDTQTAYVLTSNNDPLTTDGQLLYTIG